MPSKPDREYAPGENPASRANLRPMAPIYGEEKKVRRLTITDTGWEALQAMAKAKGARSVSDLLEKIARGDIEL